MDILSKRIAVAAQELNEEFEVATGIKTNLSSPKSIAELYQAIGVDTIADSQGNTIALDGRGDGIRVRYLPSILHYIAKNSSNMYIWGFEEPENSLEYSLALRMAEDFANTYCKHSQVLVTSHSPAFIGLSETTCLGIFRCFRDNGTKIIPIDQVEDKYGLAEELGYIQIQKEVAELLKQKTTMIDAITAQKAALLQELSQLTRPVLYTEGKTDVKILTIAWKRLYGEQECPFEIKSCNTLKEDMGSAAGCKVLRDLLVSARPDSPQLIIGLFDRDVAGMDAFSLNNNFEIMGEDDGWKCHKNKRAHALLLPIPPGKELFAEYKNLCIEFYFEKADLDLKIDGKGLKLKANRSVAKFNGVQVEGPPLEALHFQSIDESTKKYFAEVIVPVLQEASFVHFRPLFEKIMKIIQ